jgi:hypothetical protein
MELDATLGEAQIDGSPGALLLAFAKTLEASGVPLCGAFAEMVLADMSAEPRAVSATPMAADLLLEPMTDAEATASRILLAVARHARDAQLDDEKLERLMSLATVYIARFESYLAERSVPQRS